MMVEAGGTEKSWTYYETGAPKVTEEVLADGLEVAKTWIRESIKLQRQLVEQGGLEAHASPFDALHRLRRRRLERVVAVGTDRLAKANPSRPRPSATPPSTRPPTPSSPSSRPSSPSASGEVKAAVRSLTKKLVRKRIVEEGVRIDGRGTDRHPAALGRGRPAPDGARLGAVPAGRDPGAQRHARSACPG